MILAAVCARLRRLACYVMTELGCEQEFARETGELTVRRWKIGLMLYLLFASTGAWVEAREYPTRGSLLVGALGAQVLVVLAAWMAMRGRAAQPRSA